MRVPDISATAGYAANVFNPIGIQRDNTSTNSLISALGNEHNKFDNISPTGTALYYREPTTSNYASTADEFVQKALSSTPTEYSAALALNDNLSHYCCGAIPKNLVSNHQKEEVEECYDKEANPSGNTYKSFKEIFNTNKSFYEDCVRDFENINLLKNGVDHINDTDVDPIEVINSQETHNSNNECALYSSKNSFDNDFNQYSVTKCEHLEQQQQQQQQSGEKTKDPQRAVDCLHLPDDNDYDDHSMIDLCSETKSNYDSDDKDEEFLTSASSSTVSLHTQKHSFFPRGIINPNYPGFQHLAHTLSEHFVTSSPSDSYESDMSEYEMDLSADSFDSLTEDRSQIELNNFNNNTTQSITMNPSGYPHNRHENFDYIHEEEGDFYLVECDKGHRPSFDDDDANRNGHQLDNNPFNITELQDGVQSKLTMLEAAEHNGPLKDHMHVSITPDILIKNYHLQMETQFKKENRPDLLRGVSPHSVKEPVHHPPLTVDTQQQQQPGHNGFATRSSEIKDEMSFGLTPVDIIGDFGQEVEREFGLLVSGYRRLVDTQDNTLTAMEDGNKISDAALSLAKDQIDSSKYLEAFNKQTEEIRRSQILPDLADDNAVDVPMALHNPGESPKKSESSNMDHQTSLSTPSDSRLKPKYQKSSYDDRQLPPVAIEYKRCQQASRASKKPSSLNDKATKIQRITHSKPSIASRLLHPKRNSKLDKSDSSSNRKRDEAELHKYQQLISDKEEILSNSKYAKLSSWAQHLKNSVKDRGSRGSTDLISPSALELFDAYKIGTEIDMEQLQEHLKMAKEIERQILPNLNRRLLYKYRSCAQTDGDCVDGMFPRVYSQSKFTNIELTLFSKDASFCDPEFLFNIVDKFLRVTDPNVEDSKRYSRRSDREEIRRRLAMGAEENCNEQQERSPWKSDTQSRLQNDFSRITGMSSDTESHSSDSETCPKLSKSKTQYNIHNFGATASTVAPPITQATDNSQLHPYHGRPLSISCSNNVINNNNTASKQSQKEQQMSAIYNHEDLECDFFTKQAKLQIEARMALAQAKEMAHMQMEIERQNQSVSPITAIIRGSLEKVGVQMTADKRRVSRQMLTEMNIAQLQILVNSLHTHIEELNESLVNYLMERDDLHDSQDAMLVDIEELTRYIGAKEHIAQQERISSLNKCSK